ncbi:hypothetical protein [Riemerella anatipestifer]|uniref:Uncharacterized protein n=2 Tax=Riemerella anatipestifer TaxID=34085 RepID=A0AAP6LMM2_RIEAN|nr:hypothetical protein [Riemerella anatipestifer]MBT0549343.1 hypothetical protein [Riemerella anatipestifer]MBT0551018.1 hypothetical protein [Riemerella anatipestifer]MBT0553634.1 hypothetical protein [Riemerella anatipestifer]MBT0555904.1 hypothetical protein [Riemerella anatipestifer]MBT0560106.1 hypothetical protein [Riemerella anatipestifer]
MNIEYDQLEELCKKIESRVKKQKITLHFKEVLNSIYIDDKDFFFKPYKAEIFSTELYNFLFLEDSRGIDREWVLLKLVIEFSNGDLIEVDKIEETIYLKLKDLSLIE